MTAENVDPRIDAVTQRLAAEFAESAGPDAVARCIEQARAQFAGARIDAFIPMFVARHARSLLRASVSSPRLAGGERR